MDDFLSMNANIERKWISDFGSKPGLMLFQVRDEG
jgi:hypothetical protein